MTSTHKKSSKFLPLELYHQVPVVDVTPNAIKASIRNSVTDRENVNPETIRGALCKALGFNDASKFAHEFKENLRPFLMKHDLKERLGLVKHHTLDAFGSFTYHQVADRLFRKDRALPKRIFTGQGIEWWDWLQVARNHPDYKVLWFEDAVRLQRHLITFSELHEVELPEGKNIPPASYAIATEDAVLSWGNMLCFQNLVGDQFLDFLDDYMPEGALGQEYYPQGYDGAPEDNQRLIQAGLLLMSLVKNFDHGWVNVLPYNDNLIFLKGANKAYDFVFRNMRDNSFNHHTYGNFLKIADVPTTDKEYDFQRWLYFPTSHKDKRNRKPYTGWLELDRHNAESEFYASGGQLNNYPGQDELLKRYLIDKRQYEPLNDAAPMTPGFHKVMIEGKAFAVSQLVTIDEFRSFMTIHNELYAHYSRKAGVDHWETVNLDAPNLPAAVTWYDAMAYTAWISKKKRLPVRLLKEHEYRHVASCLDSHDTTKKRDDDSSLDMKLVYRKKDEEMTSYEKSYMASWKKRLCVFYHPDGTQIDGHPPCMSHEDFQSLELRYNTANISWVNSPEGLRFLNSPHFGEWLQQKAAAINCFTLNSLMSAPGFSVSATRDRFTPHSTGKYKSKKVGFRMIYELVA